MGLLKWFKRDITPLRKSFDKSYSIDNKIELSRNDSYLNALTKFNKWRQRRLLKHCTSANKVEMFNDCHELYSNGPAVLNEENQDISQTTYEEIDLNRNEQYCSLGNKEVFKKWDIDESCCRENAYLNSTAYGNKSHNFNHFKQSSEQCNTTDVAANILAESSEVPEYAIPFQNFNVEFHEDTCENNFAANPLSFNSATYYSVCQEESRRHTMVVTDLDNSKGTATAIDETDDNAKNNSLSAMSLSSKMKRFSELMLCPTECITPNKADLNFNITSGNIQHGEIADFEISFAQVETNLYEAVYNNVETLRQLRHPNIVLLMGISVDENFKLKTIIFEPLECSLYDRIHTEKEPLPMESCYKYTMQILSAVSYLHNLQYIHTNICSQNIILCRNADIVKLAGFELSIQICDIAYNDSISNHVSAPLCLEYRKEFTQHVYQAPELLANDKEYVLPTYQSDIYGICITLWEALNCVVPFNQFGYNELIKVFTLKTAYLPIIEEERHMLFTTLLEKGLEIRVENRISDTTMLRNYLQQAPYHKTEQHPHTNKQPAVPQQSPSSQFKYKTNQEVFYERTSTTKRRRALPKMKVSKPKVGANVNGEPINWSINKPILLNLHTEEAPASNKRYNVNIRIKSHNQDSIYESQCNHNDSTSKYSVKEKVNKFESLSNAPTFENSCDSNGINMHSGKSYWQEWNIPANKSYTDENRNEMIKFNYKESISLQDFYIDDDIPNDCNFGDNFKLSFSFTSSDNL